MPFLFAAKTFEGAGPQQALRRYVAVFNISEELRLNPRRVGLSDRLSKLRLRRDNRVELLSDLA